MKTENLSVRNSIILILTMSHNIFYACKFDM